MFIIKLSILYSLCTLFYMLFLYFAAQKIQIFFNYNNYTLFSLALIIYRVSVLYMLFCKNYLLYFILYVLLNPILLIFKFFLICRASNEKKLLMVKIYKEKFCQMLHKAIFRNFTTFIFFRIAFHDLVYFSIIFYYTLKFNFEYFFNIDTYKYTMNSIIIIYFIINYIYKIQFN